MNSGHCNPSELTQAASPLHNGLLLSDRKKDQDPQHEISPHVPADANSQAQHGSASLQTLKHEQVHV